MIWELIHTSAARGLNPGSRGFTTVAQTKGMPAWLSEKLQRLSAYRSVSEPSGTNTGQSPIVVRHARLVRGSESYSVLSRIAPCSDDYSGRSNRLAHHLVLDGSARDAVPAGPSWLLSRNDLFCREWNKEPEYLEARSALPNADVRPQPCRSWERATGDAGWAGEVLRRVLDRPGQGLYVRYLSDHNMLEMLTEASALLAPELRWKLTFQAGSMDDPPTGLDCVLRCVPQRAGVSPSIRGMAPYNTMDLTAPKTLRHSAYVQNARRGEPIEVEGPRTVRSTRELAAAASRDENPDRRSAENGGTDVDAAPYDLVPLGDLVTDTEVLSTRAPRPSRSGEFERRKMRKWVLTSGLVGAVVGLLIGFTVGVKVFRPSEAAVSQEPSGALPESVGEQEEHAVSSDQADKPVENSPARPPSEDLAKGNVRHGTDPETGTTPPKVAGAIEPKPDTPEVPADLSSAVRKKPARPLAEGRPRESVRWTKVEIDLDEIKKFQFDPAVITFYDDAKIPTEWMDHETLQIAWLADLDGSPVEVPAWKIEGNIITKDPFRPLAIGEVPKPPESPELMVSAEIGPNDAELGVSLHKLNYDGEFAEIYGFCLRHPSENRALLLLWNIRRWEQVKLRRKTTDDPSNVVYTSGQQVPLVHWIQGRNDHWVYEVRSDDRSKGRIRETRHKGASSYRPALSASYEDYPGGGPRIRVTVTVASRIKTAKPDELKTPFLVALRAALQPAIDKKQAPANGKDAPAATDKEQPKRSVTLPNVYGVPMIELVFPKPKPEAANENENENSATGANHDNSNSSDPGTGAPS